MRFKGINRRRYLFLLFPFPPDVRLHVRLSPPVPEISPSDMEITGQSPAFECHTLAPTSSPRTLHQDPSLPLAVPTFGFPTQHLTLHMDLCSLTWCLPSLPGAFYGSIESFPPPTCFGAQINQLEGTHGPLARFFGVLARPPQLLDLFVLSLMTHSRPDCHPGSDAVFRFRTKRLVSFFTHSLFPFAHDFFYLLAEQERSFLPLWVLLRILTMPVPPVPCKEESCKTFGFCFDHRQGVKP